MKNFPEAVIFDMDGVLIDARDWHFEALNLALSYFGVEISYEEHLENFDGLPTKKKLQMLSEQERLPLHVHDLIEQVKQERTLRIAANRCYPLIPHLILIGWLKNNGIKIAVATNSVRETSVTMLTYAGIMANLDLLVTNQDVRNTKPDPEIYLTTCKRLKVAPENTIVFEDNINGINSARSAGCFVAEVKNLTDVNLSRFKTELINWQKND